MALEYDLSQFHLAILDFDMPALKGFQLLLRLRTAHASFPIVLLGGMSRELPNDMRIVFSSCLDKGEPIHILPNTKRSYLAPITAHGEEAMRHQAMRAGAVEFLPKPFDDEYMVEGVRAALDR
jgi:FixJ family two-component response regulator